MAAGSSTKKSTSSKSSGNSSGSSSSTTKVAKPPKNFIVRPVGAVTKFVSKVYLNPETLKLLGFNSGDIVHISDFDSVSNGILGIASALTTNVNESNNTVEISLSLRKLAGFQLGKKVSIEKINYQPSYAITISIALCYKLKKHQESKEFEVSNRTQNKLINLFNDVGIICPGLPLSEINLVDNENQEIGSCDISIFDVNNEYLPTSSIEFSSEDSVIPKFEKLSMEDREEDNDNDFEQIEEGSVFDEVEAETNLRRLVSPVYIFDKSKTEIKIVFKTKDKIDEEFNYPYIQYPNLPKLITFKSIGGLDGQLKQIKNIMKVPLQKPKIFSFFNIKPSRGVLLFGPSGTGKTMILNALVNEFFNKVHIIRIDGPSVISKYLGDAELKLKELFNEAKLYQPSIILIDEIDSLLPNRNANDEEDSNENRLIATLLTLMDSLENSSKIMIVGATNRPNNIDTSLRRPGRFDKEIEIGIPDIDSRQSILHNIIESMGVHNNSVTEEDISTVASKTHGYVGADLIALIREAIMITIQQKRKCLTVKDIELALNEIRPSAMREIFLEMPKVHWSDIGGQEELKRKLKEMVQLPLEASETFKQLGVSAPKGVLLYGPPGCSKTLTAKALATESGLNFLAVKGPEIFNKYVGESEKKIREIFRKARAASPSIIFFDEIDALSPDRIGGDSSGSSTSGHVLTTLLNEIDGVEELNGVIIVGATNKPTSIDPALLRPGRLDRHIYVGPPSEEAILKILKMRTKKFNLENEEEFLCDLAKRLNGCSGAEVVLVCQEAGINAIMEDLNTNTVKAKHFERVVANLKKNINLEMLAYYEEFSNST